MSLTETHMPDIKQQLCQLADQQNLVAHAKAFCKTWLADEEVGWQGDSTKLISGFLADDIEQRLQKHSFVFKSLKLEYEYIDTKIDLYVQASSGELQVGHYRLITTLDGFPVDDYLVFYPDFEVLLHR